MLICLYDKNNNFGCSHYNSQLHKRIKSGIPDCHLAIIQESMEYLLDMCLNNERVYQFKFQSFTSKFLINCFAFEIVMHVIQMQIVSTPNSGLQEFLFQSGSFTVSDYWCCLTANSPCVDVIGSSECWIIMHHILR